jgi:hypothetical protein
MIVPELIMTEIVSTVKPISYNSSELLPSFHYGGKDELKRYLDIFQDKVYPLIWMLPSVENHGVKEVLQDVEFILAVNINVQDKDVLNNVRINQNFVHLLNPLCDNLLTAIKKAHNASFDNSSFQIKKFPNYRETRISNDGTPKVSHYWDALTLSLNMGFFNKC